MHEWRGVLSVDGIGWANWLAFWAALGAVGLVWTQLAWGPCWGTGADDGLTAEVRIALMTAAGGALLLPFLLLNVVLDAVWFLYGLFLALYGLVMGLLGGTVLATWDRQDMPASKVKETQNGVDPQGG